MRGFVLWGVGYTLLGGCVFDPTGESGGSQNDESSGTASTAGSGAPTTAATTPSSTSPTDPSTSSTTSDDPSTSDPSTGTSETSPTSGDPTDTGDPPVEGCPEELPEGWIVCQDFEDPGAIEEDFHLFNTNDVAGFDHFRFDDAVAFTGNSSLLVEHVQDVDWSGAAWIRFGSGPADTPYAPKATFDEVWVRLHVMLDDGWDIGGFGDVIEINSVTTNFAHVMSASIDAPAGGAVLRARARTCVQGGTTIMCDGMQDWLTLQELANAPGPTPFFDGGSSGDWHCLVAHVRIGDPGQSNGLIEVNLDGELESEIGNVNFRGMVEGVGLNALHLSAFWGGGSPQTVRRYFDDLVVSEQPLDCD